ncbi:phosphopyruvate hydratase [Streptomyces reniochalinae]|uniref:Enolase n=1 Tax=Streptomyces reniochalinae TaxID=2250578 RepID=A0A367EKW7_9ACTN|nr:phosphopyruvate hydratase [Streptomyces reniochalinae]RCG18704.1 phosphopyruvate hydratase [Streptomyces reniochalinae]
MSLRISRLHATEILDSRARPTLEVSLLTPDGHRAVAGVPSGASTGTREARELRDGDPERFGGQGVSQAVEHVNTTIAEAVVGRSFPHSAALDAILVELDGTENKERLGANAVTGVSMAAARAFALAEAEPLWQWIARQAGTEARLPVPHFNVLNGGAHAANGVDFQEFMIAPLGAPSLPEAVREAAEVYGRLKARLAAAGLDTGLGDEGGFAPALDRPEQVLEHLVAAIEGAGHTAGSEGIAIAIDPAASEFYREGLYHVAGKKLTAEALIDRYEELVDRFPIWSIEDGLAEDDWDGWGRLTSRLGERVQVMGDDIFVTNPGIISEAIGSGIGNSALIKVNQIGTLSETLEAMQLCRNAGYTQMVSHRSGETPDSFIADLAVGTGCGQLKSGAPARGERVAKYNRLIDISEDRPDLAYGLA